MNDFELTVPDLYDSHTPKLVHLSLTVYKVRECVFGRL